MNLLVSRYAKLTNFCAPAGHLYLSLSFKARRPEVMSTPSPEIVSTTAVPGAARDDFEEDSAKRRTRARTIQALDSMEQSALAIELLHYSEDVKRTRNRERYVTRTLLGYEDSAEARAERAEAEVAALKDQVAELRERNGKLEGKVEVFERLFSIVEARPKQ